MVAACPRVFLRDRLTAGELKHLGVLLTEKGLSLPSEPVLPPASSGKFSDRNINGYEVVRKDLPKETHYNSVEAPDWGDFSIGTHPVDLPYEKYPRDFYGPQNSRIKIDANTFEAGKKEYMLTFEIDRVLDRKSPTFEEDLLSCLNLLQENVGACGVEKSGVSFADYLESVNVSWEVLPPGSREEVVERIFAHRRATQEARETAGDRYDFFMKLNPKKLIFGTSGLQRYFGALLEDDLVVFENIEYGNAIYVMFDEWKELSKRSRTELLSGRYGSHFERVAHISGWKGRLQNIVKTRRRKK